MEKIKGYIDHFIYRNSENGYGVMVFISDGEEITCVGTFLDVDTGDTLEIEGELTEHPVYGEQIKVSSYEVSVPDDAESIERYLGSGAIKGIGETMARRIVKKFGADTFRIIEDEPERLAEIKGISERKARDIAIQLADKRDMREAMVFLAGYGISNTLSVKIFDKYGNQVYRIMKENPYRLADDIEGVGFKTADEIASRVGISVDSDYRVRSGILYTLLEAASDGNSYLPRKMLLSKSKELLKVEEDLIDTQIDNLMVERKLVLRDDAVYASTYYYEEQSIAAMLSGLNLDLTSEVTSDDAALIKRIKSIEKDRGIELDELQRKAVMASAKNGVVIITGGPGTGKTTTINTIIQYYAQEQMDILLAAPTGRAAKRMTEATGYEAQTIHRLLGVGGMPASDDNGEKSRDRIHFDKNAENPLEADAIIIDEMSMVDMHLFNALLKAVIPGTHLILVGDSSQLPSVGPGQVLSDIISTGAFPTLILQKIFRQAKESDIVMNAHHIKKGEHITMDNKSKDFFFLKRDNADVIYKHMLELIQKKLPGYVNATSGDIQVLTPMKRGPLGAETLNVVLQKYLNPVDDKKREYTYGERLFREGDKVMQIKNNYQAEWEVLGKYGIPTDSGMGVFNGDMGFIKEINNPMRELTVEFDEGRCVTYPFSELDELELAYAITIHKSQGSEYPAVILPLLGGPRMLLNRNLLYTAVTRARSCVVVLGSDSTVQEMIDNEEQLKRYTGLRTRIEEAMKLHE
ncbi:SF1B family DNA helicase RecD2 [Butyrivibrio sp. MB2005]|uniref:SF1B family DNA helicase RecD2 n=1 Tax=Butyrivibrio sp. MB2005 TaxID=1280678 RepID=UPI0004099799|nr:ATP-dependent RecD-like DNA helicase [Butyrivibrio sp. MB2005]